MKMFLLIKMSFARVELNVQISTTGSAIYPKPENFLLFELITTAIAVVRLELRHFRSVHF